MKTFEAKKLYYSIGEVSKITALPAYLLRHWENDFPELSPARNPKGNRIYTHKDIAVALAIKKLVYEQGYTIEKAKALMQGQTISTDDVKETETLLKAHQPPAKLHHKQDEQRKALLLETKAVIEDLLDYLK